MSRDPTPKQLAFIKAYNDTRNATEAHRRSYPGKYSQETREKEGQRLLRHPLLVPLLVRANAVVEAKVMAAAETIGISKERLIRELGAMGLSSMKNHVKLNDWGEPRFDFTNLSDASWMAIREITITETKIPMPEGQPEQFLVTTKLRLHDSLNPLRELIQLLGYAKQVNPDDDLDRMTNEELKQSVVEKFRRLVTRQTAGQEPKGRDSQVVRRGAAKRD